MTITEQAEVHASDDPAEVARDHTPRWVALGAAVVSVCVYVYFARKGMAVGYMDSVAHLQIAARTLDSPTAGFGQLGGVWLPLPHLLMLPLVWHTPFYYNGFAGSAISMISYVVACVYVYKIGFGLTRVRIAAIGGLLVFALNPNVLYMQSTPMTEMLLFATTAAMVYCVQRWIQIDEHANKYPYLFAAALAGFFACLTRYEAWAMTVVMGAIILCVAWRQYGRQAAEGVSLAFALLAGAAIAFWLGWNLVIFGNPLNFQNGEYAKPSNWVDEDEAAVGHLIVAAKTYWYAMLDNLGLAIVVGMIVGAFAMVLFRRRLDSLPVLGLLTIVPFFVFTLYAGQRPLHVPEIPPYGTYNIRFGLIVIVPAAILVAYLISLLPSRLGIAGLAAAVACTALPLMPAGPTNLVTAREATAGYPVNATTTSDFLREHYDGGVILLQSFGSESILFKARIPLSRNVYEGSYQKWDPALSNPPGQEVRWIVMRTGAKPDDTYLELFASPKLRGYEEVFRNDLYIVYRIKD